MRVVNLDQEIHHRELQLMRPKPAGLALRREAVPQAEPQRRPLCRIHAPHLGMAHRPSIANRANSPRP